MKTGYTKISSSFSKKAGKNNNKFRKLLTLAAVILFIWILGKGFVQSSQKQANADNVVAGETVQGGTTTALEASFLNGPIAGIQQILFNAAQSAPDLSVDDSQENSDLVFMQENSLMGANSPNPSDSNVFSQFRKDVVTYIVKAGDNPEKIGISFGISADTILQANNLKDGDLIKPGDKLVILPINGIRIKVASKDSVNSLAQKYKGKADEVIAFNNLQDNSLKAGDYLIIPGGEIPVAPALPNPKNKNSKSNSKVTAPKYASGSQKADDWLIIPTTGMDWGIVHSFNGVDIANVCGTPIYAAASGQIILADDSGWNGGYGKYIKIQHPNGVITLYGHLSRIVVGDGESVSQGELIGLMGTTGRSTGCHLHFEVRGAHNPLAKR